MLKLENSIRGLSFSRVAFDLTIQDRKNIMYYLNIYLIYELENANKKFYTKYINGCSIYGRVILEPIVMALFYFFILKL